MKKILKYLYLLSSAVVLICCSSYNDSALTDRTDDLRSRLDALKSKVEQIKTQITALSELTSGNVITSVTQNSDGNYVITCRDSSDKQFAVVVASPDQMISLPLLGVEKGDDGIYYWTTTVDGTTTFLTDSEGNKMAVAGYTPNVTVDSEGYWTVDGARITDSKGNPIAATDADHSIIKGISTDTDGNLQITLSTGETVTMPVIGTLNITLDTQTVTTIADTSKPVTVKYALTGTAADQSLFDIALAENITATIDKAAEKITVGFNDGFKQGKLIVVAYDLERNTIIKPLFFNRLSSGNIEISTAAELVAFASAVNRGGSEAKGTAVLLGDIDMAAAGSWTPIGNGTITFASNVLTINGASFGGTFDGQGHSILNFKMATSPAEAGTAYGLFGVLNGATVKNLTIGAPTNDSGSLTVAASASCDAGVVAGVCYDSTIDNCTSYIPMSYTGTSGARVTMAMAGMMFTNEQSSAITNCTNYGAINAVDGGSTQNGAAAIQVAGIAGFASNDASSVLHNTVSKCTNNGDMQSATARTSGIVAAANRYTKIENCTNNGNQTNTFPKSGNGRLGNITCITGQESHLSDCINRGDLVSTTSARCGGLVSLVNHVSCTITRCENYGAIVSDEAVYNGLFWGYCNVAATITDCVAGGTVGTYNAGNPVLVTLTSDNFMDYLGKTGSSAIVTGTRFGGTDKAGIKSAGDLMAFAAAVNSGSSTEQWQNSEGAIELLTDIDMAGIEWIPIGNATISFASNHVTITGNAFTGTFEGNGHTLKNLKLAYSDSQAGAAYGLFGVTNGATIRNLTIGSTADDAGSLTVTASGTGTADTGVIAGVAVSSTISNCISYIPMIYNGTATVRVTMGMIGFAFGGEKSTELSELKNHGQIEVNTNGNSLNGLGTAIHVGGICGLSSGDATTKSVNEITYCDNYGNITSNSARTSGIVAAANSYTHLGSCVNHGNQFNTVGDTGRLGNITCITGTGSYMTECINNGDLISTSAARCGGLVSLPNHATNSFSGCANYGKVITDSAYRGLFFGYNNMACTWINCTAGGNLGVYNNGTYVYDSYPESLQLSYLGKQGSTTAQTENITYSIGSTESGGETPSTIEPKLRILFIGNSFTKDAVEHLPKMLEAAGINDVLLVHMYYGGRTIPEYANNYSSATDYTCYRCSTGSSIWVSQSGYSLHTMVESEKWDIVTIQEHTGNKCAWIWDDAEKGAIDLLLNNIKADQGTNTPEYVYIMTQAYYNMSKIATASQPYKNFTTQQEMFDVICTQAKNVLTATAVDRILPTGTVLQNLRTSSLNVDNDMDLTRDGYHMDYGISRYAAACAVFESLITPKYGTKLDDNTFRYTVSNTVSGSYSTPVTDANQPIALQAARYALSDPYSVTDMSK